MSNPSAPPRRRRNSNSRSRGSAVRTRRGWGSAAPTSRAHGARRCHPRLCAHTAQAACSPAMKAPPSIHLPHAPRPPPHPQPPLKMPLPPESAARDAPSRLAVESRETAENHGPPLSPLPPLSRFPPSVRRALRQTDAADATRRLHRRPPRCGARSACSRGGGTPAPSQSTRSLQSLRAAWMMCLQRVRR